MDSRRFLPQPSPRQQILFPTHHRPRHQKAPARLGLRHTVTDAAGTRTLAYDPDTLEPTTETFGSGMFNGLVIKQDYQTGSGSGIVAGRWAGVRVGTSGDDDAYYAAGYGYDTVGRMDHVSGPGLPAGGGTYSFVEGINDGNTELVSQLALKDSGGTVKGWTGWSYETNRDLVTVVENNFGATTNPISRYTYAYDVLARRKHVVREGAAFAADHMDKWYYDGRNELTENHRYLGTDPDDPGDAVPALDRGYAYDPIGNRTSHDEGDTPIESSYVRSALNQYDRVDTVGGAPIRQGYAFDLDGNMSEQWLVGDANCDGLLNFFDIDSFVAAIENPDDEEPPAGFEGDQECWDRRLEWGDINADGYLNNFDIDPFVEVLISGAAISKRFTWDGENRLIAVAPAAPAAGSKRINFDYDYLGRRIGKRIYAWNTSTSNWATTPEWHHRYVWNGWLLLLELNALDSNSVVRKFTWGRDLSGTLEGAGGIGGLLAVYDASVSSGVNYVDFYDANGDVGQVIDLTASSASASLKARYEYDPYGRVIGPDDDADGDWRDDAGAYATTNAWRFSTKQWDDETGLGYWDERYYDARLGSWNARDPNNESGGFHLYAYVANRPIADIDPTGRIFWFLFGCDRKPQTPIQTATPCEQAVRNAETDPHVQNLKAMLRQKGCAVPGPATCTGGYNSAPGGCAYGQENGVPTIKCSGTFHPEVYAHELIHALQDCPSGCPLSKQPKGFVGPPDPATHQACWEVQAYSCSGQCDPNLFDIPPGKNCILQGCVQSMTSWCQGNTYCKGRSPQQLCQDAINAGCGGPCNGAQGSPCK